MKSIINLLANDGYLIYNKELAHKVGVHEAIILGELISEYVYYTNRNELTEDNMFYSTIENVQKNTALNEFYQRKALKHLKELGLIKCVLRGIPRFRYISINELAIIDLLCSEPSNEHKNESKEEPTSTDCRTVPLQFKDTDPYSLKDCTSTDCRKIIINKNNNNNNNSSISKEENSEDISKVKTSTVKKISIYDLSTTGLKYLQKMIEENRDTKNVQYTEIQKLFNLKEPVSYRTPELCGLILKERA